MALYFLSNIFLQVYVFKAFLNQSQNKYQLDPVYFENAPQFAWNALLKDIDKPIPLISDPAIYRMIQQNLRGGYIAC